MILDRENMHSSKVFQVKLTGEIIWKELKSMNKIRDCRILFKMKYSIYAIGGTYCERYDLQEETWVDCQHELPTIFTFGPSSVAVSEDESFAVMTACSSRYKHTTCQYKESLFIFTEEHGFEMFDTCSRYWKSPILYLSIPMK